MLLTGASPSHSISSVTFNACTLPGQRFITIVSVFSDCTQPASNISSACGSDPLPAPPSLRFPGRPARSEASPGARALPRPPLCSPGLEARGTLRGGPPPGPQGCALSNDSFTNWPRPVFCGTEIHQWRECPLPKLSLHPVSENSKSCSQRSSQPREARSWEKALSGDGGMFLFWKDARKLEQNSQELGVIAFNWSFLSLVQ